MRRMAGTAKALMHAVRLIKDPTRLDEVFGIIDSVSRPDIVLDVARKGAETPEGARAIRDWPRVDIDLPALVKLPPGTLGREFADHMRRNNLDPADIPVKPVTSELEFVEAHLRETHDILHVVTGFNTDVPGELGLQAFYLAQLPVRLPVILIGGGMFRLMFYEFSLHERIMDSITQGWTLGRQARPFFGLPWNDLWDKPLSEVRARLNIAQA